jgi:hypothetical protein
MANKSTEYLESEAICASFSPALTIPSMNTSNISRLPKHAGRTALGQSLDVLLKKQEIFATTVWEFFNSLGYRLDQHDQDLKTVRDRLWNIEHSERRTCEENRTWLPAYRNPAGSRGNEGIGPTQERRNGNESFCLAGVAGKDDPRRIAARRGQKVTADGERLMDQAQTRYGEIFPCAGRNWEGCVTEERGFLMFWFNSADGNTHVISERKEPAEKAS